MLPGSEFKALPPVTSLEDDRARKEIIRLLEELDTLVIEKSKMLGREDQIKDRLEELQQETGRRGFRFGLLCYTAVSVTGHKTLDKMALMEHGVPASVITLCTKEGEPSIRRNFRRLKEDEI